MKKKFCCPSPDNPCMCKCHREAEDKSSWKEQCWECKMGRHKPKIKDLK